MPSDSEKPGPKVDATLSKGLKLLEALTAAPGGKGVTELSRDLGLTKSNVYRLLQTLTVLGYAMQTEDKLYRATLKTWQTGRRVVEGLNLRAIASEAMQYLSRETGEAVYLAVAEGLQVVYIDKIESRQPIRTWNPVGGTAPIHAVGTGKAILAASYPRMRTLLIGNLKRYTELTLTSIEALDADISLTQRRGYGVDRGEFREQIWSFGAPINLPGGEGLASIGLSAPETNLAPDPEAHYGALVREAARQVSAALEAV